MVALFSGFVLVGDRLALDAAFKVAVIVTIMALVKITWLNIGAALARFSG